MKKKRMDLFLLLCIILSSIVAVIGFGYGFLVVFVSAGSNNGDVASALLNIFSGMFGIGIIIYTVFIIIGIWLIFCVYLLIKTIIKKIVEKKNNKNKTI